MMMMADLSECRRRRPGGYLLLCFRPSRGEFLSCRGSSIDERFFPNRTSKTCISPPFGTFCTRRCSGLSSDMFFVVEILLMVSLFLFLEEDFDFESRNIFNPLQPPDVCVPFGHHRQTISSKVGIHSPSSSFWRHYPRRHDFYHRSAEQNSYCTTPSTQMFTTPSFEIVRTFALRRWLVEVIIASATCRVSTHPWSEDPWRFDSFGKKIHVARSSNIADQNGRCCRYFSSFLLFFP